MVAGGCSAPNAVAFTNPRWGAVDGKFLESGLSGLHSTESFALPRGPGDYRGARGGDHRGPIVLPRRSPERARCLALGAGEVRDGGSIARSRSPSRRSPHVAPGADRAAGRRDRREAESPHPSVARMRGRVSLAGDAYQGATIERRDVATERGQTAVFVGPRKHRRAWDGHRLPYWRRAPEPESALLVNARPAQNP